MNFDHFRVFLRSSFTIFAFDIRVSVCCVCVLHDNLVTAVVGSRIISECKKNRIEFLFQFLEAFRVRTFSEI